MAKKIPHIPRPPSDSPLAERLAYRSISDALRSLADPAELGKALLLIFSGQDPFRGNKNKDGLPVAKAVPIDMTHRMTAVKLYLEYAYGKPLQGLIVDGQMRQGSAESSNQRVLDLHVVAKGNPEARAALRQLAQAVLKKPAEDPNSDPGDPGDPGDPEPTE